MAWFEHIPILIMSRNGIQILPGRRTERRGKLWWSRDFYQCFGCNGEMRVSVRDIEVVYPVSQSITIGHNLRFWAGGQAEVETVLKTIASGLNADLHNTFRDGRTVAEARDVMNCIIQHSCMNLSGQDCAAPSSVRATSTG